MKHLHRCAALTLLAAASSASFADNITAPLDLSLGNASFGRNDAVGIFTDTYTFTLANSSYFVTSTASSASSGTQDLDFTSLVIQNALNTVVATFSGNLGNDVTEFYFLNPTLLVPGAYRLIVTGTNSPSQASYSGNMAITAAVPEPASGALVLAGLSVLGFMARRQKMD